MIQKEGASSLDYAIEHIEHIEQRKPFTDSFSYHLGKGQFVCGVIVASSAFETVKSSGLELVKSNSHRQEIINLFEVTYPYLLKETKRFEDQLWLAVKMTLVQNMLK